MFLGLFLAMVSSLIILRFLYKTSIFHIFLKWWRGFEDQFHVYQTYKIPQYNEHYQENQLYRKISVYLNSLVSLDDSDLTNLNLFSGSKSNEILLHFDANQIVYDTFFSARVSWTNEPERDDDGNGRSYVLKIRKNDKRRVLRPYLQHILSATDEIEQRKKEIRLNMNLEGGNGRWRSIPFTHPASFDTVVMDADLKTKVRSDLEQFLKSKQYYHRLGRVWKRSYLLYGPPGTGKTSFVAAMARFLCYDVYDIDMSKVSDDSELKTLLLRTTTKSLVVIEDLDRFFAGKQTAVSLSGMLNFMDGIVSCCGEESVMVFTMNVKDQVDQTAMRPGRIDVHIEFPTCDFSAFKSMASGYLGVKDHKLFPQVEEVFQTGASLSHAEIGEIMISNRNSPSRALKSVIAALQSSGDGRGAIKAGPRLSGSSSGRSVDDSVEPPASVFCRESVHTVREFRKLYGLLKMGSRRKESLDLSSVEKDKEGSRHNV
ncbi:AAA-ATPase At2g46620-like [Juglans microcarpa x Juglans regia]|uniref:AAA-ATPase At2g46620-like n=1 Tax=Juglans microcarpa x Juglans regia TaxID=2249226 RepID=UPI001B7DBE24|nr:AAA-ATPase At2g46620-like [Juglans microcarpa x Juglans regia]